MARTRISRRRKGSAYVFFMGTALLVTVIGLSTLTLMRVKLQAAEYDDHEAAARVHARSAIELALLAIYNDANWRDNIDHDCWQPLQSIGQGQCTWKLVDEINGNLTADRSAPVRAYGQGVCGESVWIYSVGIQPPIEEATAISELLVNGDLNSGSVSPWYADGGCQILTDSQATYEQDGTPYMWVRNRPSPLAGPCQSLSALKSGSEYKVVLWARFKNVSVADRIWLGLRVTTDVDSYYFDVAETDVGVAWKMLEGTITPVWAGTVTSAALAIGSISSTDEMLIDNISMTAVRRPVVGPLPGTWRREPR